nr:hypothetical protein [Rhodoferax sp.]
MDQKLLLPSGAVSCGRNNFSSHDSTVDEHSRTRFQNAVAELGGADKDLRVFTGSDGALRDLQLAVLPEAAHALDWYHLTRRLTILASVISGKPAAAELQTHDQNRLSEWMDSLKWRLWHGRTPGAIKRLQDMLEKMERKDKCLRRRQIDPGGRHSLTQRDVRVIVAGCGMAVTHSGSVRSRHVGQNRVGANTHWLNIQSMLTTGLHDKFVCYCRRPSRLNSLVISALFANAVSEHRQLHGTA